MSRLLNKCFIAVIASAAKQARNASRIVAGSLRRVWRLATIGPDRLWQPAGSRSTIAAIALLALGVAHAESLYREGDFKPYAADARALRVGDNLTVIVTEFASVTTQARTATDKDGTLSGSLTGTNSSKSGAINLAEDFTGGGRIERSGKLVAQLTVVVQAIDANGDLRVKGQQEISVNNEVQTLNIEGRVRPQDILANNTVLSNRLSDAKISYTGDGLLAEKQRPGILTRIFSWLRLL